MGTVPCSGGRVSSIAGLYPPRASSAPSVVSVKTVFRRGQISTKVVVGGAVLKRGYGLKGGLAGSAFPGIPSRERSHVTAFSQHSLGKERRRGPCIFAVAPGGRETVLVEAMSSNLE